MIAKNFGLLVDGSSGSFNDIPVRKLISITSRDNLAVASESVVYKVVCVYVNHNRSHLSDQDVKDLFETVRFPFLSFGRKSYSKTTSILVR